MGKAAASVWDGSLLTGGEGGRLEMLQIIGRGRLWTWGWVFSGVLLLQLAQGLRINKHSENL